MINSYFATTAAAVLCSAALMAQTPAAPGADQKAPAPQPITSASSATASATLTGCVYQEKDVPGRAPNPAERAGILEDYILVADANTPGGGAVGTAGSASAAKAGSMFKLEHADDSKLKSMVGKRVQVTGKIDAESGDYKGSAENAPTTSQADRAVGHDKIDLAEFEVSTISEVSGGSCPATPAAR